MTGLDRDHFERWVFRRLSYQRFSPHLYVCTSTVTYIDYIITRHLHWN